MIERLGARVLAGPTTAAPELAGADGVESANLAVEPGALDVAEPVTAAASGSVEELLALPPAEHRGRHQALGEGTEALARVVARPRRPGEPSAEARLREVAARYLALRREVAEGVARITIG